ncbi:hypothetical protein I308_104127 [Cryptococcus tetragattii IND107]|uniref:Endonuclease III homolog n=1 Tax=Cryptococcus tetragattii IND107 TaxID=1296105 RepID=A0ABR3BST1_9TREE
MSRRPNLPSTKSVINNSVAIVTADAVKEELPSPKLTYTSLRRSTRSSVTAEGPASPVRNSKLNIAKYEYKGPTPSSRKRQKIDDIVKKEKVETKTSPIKSPAKKPLPQVALAKPHSAPAKWEEQYQLIEKMRRGFVAPVDEMGCERPRTNAEGDPKHKTFRFHILISLMLSSQTKDAVTSAAVTSLHTSLPGGLTAASLATAPLETIQECINKVGFWRRKAEYIQEAARTLLEQEGDEKGDVPKTVEGLCKLKGVGPKMAFLALQCAWDINAGIGVDVHVHRITNRLKWHRPPTSTPEQTRLNLQSWLPPHLHKPINPLMVGFGQVICLPVGPRCDICLLGQKEICPSRVKGANSKGRKEVVYSFKEEGDEVAVGQWRWGQAKGVESEAKVEIGYEEGLENIEDEESVSSIKVEQVIEEPGMRRPDEVLEILDQVDGPTDIGAEPVIKTENVDW